ncbi:PepSY-associated TM helix domain-containing protein [Bacillus haynesii]|uniref:PepSY-associated TM helix domain-containing protein n=1 Tax=Bacillus haynesii TaxID=1925021 RepID=UPI001F6010F2|nr:PepSY domain-containing protein [Bacillus haynesii]MCI4126518.1 PepSY domain-containing protein [Bacillus haynesii]
MNETRSLSQKESKRFKPPIYQTFWRWHFYAGLIVAPFLIILAVTGGIYLFKPQIEELIYQDYYHVTPQKEKLSPEQQIAEAAKRYPDGKVVRFRPGEDDSRSSEVGIAAGDATYTVYVNPYSGNVMGTLEDQNKLMNRLEALHGELMAGTIGDRIVELAACWSIILIVTGIYLWWPRKSGKLTGVLLPRLSKGKKVLWRDLHAVPQFWLSAGMFFLIITGLPWSGLWGNTVQTLATNSGIGYPPSIWVGEKPASDVTAKEVADVPWAAEHMTVPQSRRQKDMSISINDVVGIAEERNVHSGYNVFFPQEPKGVFTLSVFPPRAQDEATVHIDQYTGGVLADYRYQDYGALGKSIALGITLHKGSQFGFVNQLIGLAICIGIVSVSVSGFVLWRKRKPKSGLGVPPAPKNKKTIKPLVLIMIFFGLFFPLVGLSLIAVLLLDRFVIRRISVLRSFFSA